jgi:hypothetical protein
MPVSGSGGIRGVRVGIPGGAPKLAAESARDPEPGRAHEGKDPVHPCETVFGV